MPTNIDQIEALFNRAIEFPSEERAAFLAGACGQDSVLIARIQALLAAHDADAAILPEQPRSGAARPSHEKPGDRIGHYKLLEQIGEGGCGIVYMAGQEQPVRRLVALKVIKLGMDTRKVVARFEAERQALALMDHPNIAKVLDAGTTQSGRPFFVMELVRGVKITDFCQQRTLTTAQRLDLVIQCCRAIQHAHQKGIIHRDIKPSNILVSDQDGIPVPKVIDFGIAKAIEGHLTDQTLFTAFEQFIGTPAYMSPEQAQLRGLDVDTRTDIYSLGVLLYELLTGQTPFNAKELLLAGVDEMRKTILEKEPLRPSTRLTIQLTAVEASKRQAPLDHPAPDWLARKKELIHLLRGDLDWIVMKCLEKDRTRRYETANGLAMDLQRHISGEPVVARPPTTVYRVQKLIRRNKLPFAAAAAVAAALVIGTLGSTLEAIRARKAELEQGHLRAEAERASAGEARQRAAAEENLYEALLREARAKELSGRAGQRFESLEAINKAAAIHRSVDLSDAAIAAFALPDFREHKSWRFPSHVLAENLCFDDSFEWYARFVQYAISIRRVLDDQEMARLPIADPGDFVMGPFFRGFDPGRHYLAAVYVGRLPQWRCRVWDVIRGGSQALDSPSSEFPDFSPEGDAIAVMDTDQTIAIKELPSGRNLKTWHVAAEQRILRFSPNSKELAGIERSGLALRIWNIDTGQITTTLISHTPLSSFAWNDDGTLIASGCENGNIDLWEVASGRLRAHLEGHDSWATHVAFSHQRDLLASASWDRTVRLWDLAAGKQVLVYRTQDTDLHFSPDDRLLAYALEGDSARLLEVAHSTGYQRFSGHSDTSKSWSVDLSPDGRVALISTDLGLEFCDLASGKRLGLLPTTECRSACFQTSAGLSVLAATLSGLQRWPLFYDSGSTDSILRVGPPGKPIATGSFRYLSFDAQGRRIAVSTEDRSAPFLFDSASPTNILRLKGHEGAEFVALSPNGRWVASGTWKGSGVKIYDAADGRVLCDLPVARSASVAFSPDGKWLAASDMIELRLWKAGTWEPLPASLHGDEVAEINPFTFSPDGRLLASVQAVNSIRIVKVPSMEPVATLRTATIGTISSIRFSPDGTKLAVLEWSGQLNLWDFRQIRRELRKLNLDWNVPEAPVENRANASDVAVLQLDAGPFSRKELRETIPVRSSDTPMILIDLTSYYNAPLTQSWHSPSKSDNSLSQLRSGVQELGATQFDVRGLIQIGAFAANGLPYPNHILGIPVGQKCHRLHFLHSAIFADGARPGDELGSYILHFIDGRSIELPIVTGKDMVDWWSPGDAESTNLVTAWTGSNLASRHAGRSLHLFHTTWENPFPDVTIRQLDFTSDKPTPGQPFLLAVTADP